MKAYFFLLSCLSWFVVVSASNNKLKRKELSASFSLWNPPTDVMEFNFEGKFINLVKEALGKELPKLFSNESNFSMDEEEQIMERYIHSVYEKYFNDLKWSYTLRKICMDLKIFGEELSQVNQFIPIGLSRILKAEGVDINQLFKNKPAINDWTRKVDNVAQVYSKILGRKVVLNKDNFLPSLAWLFVKYHYEYPGKRSILTTPCSEEDRIPRERDSNEIKGMSVTADEEHSSDAEVVATSEPAAKRTKYDEPSRSIQQNSNSSSFPLPISQHLLLPGYVPSGGLQFDHEHNDYKSADSNINDFKLIQTQEADLPQQQLISRPHMQWLLNNQPHRQAVIGQATYNWPYMSVRPQNRSYRTTSDFKLPSMGELLFSISTSTPPSFPFHHHPSDNQSS